MTTIWALTSSGGFCAGCIPIRTVPLRSGMRTGCSRNRRSSTWGTTAITNWLVEQRILQKVTTPDGKQRRVPTEEGPGLYTETRQGMHGEYEAVLYGPEAQRFLLEHLTEIFGGK